MQNQIPNNWQKVKLGKVVDITSSKRIFAREYLKEGIPFYRGKEIIEKFNGNKISLDLFISQKKYDEIKVKFGVPQSGDMLLTSVGTLGVPYLVDQNEKFYFKDGNLTWFRKHNGIDSKFLFYWILSSLGKEQLMKHTIGSSQQALTIDGLKNIDIFLPKIDEQKRIISILSSFDDKIELNNKINKTLEEMANTIFKEWFIKFRFPGWEKTEFIDSELGKIPIGWEVIKLEKILKLKHGYAFKGNKFINEKTNNIVVRMGNFQENSGLQFLNNTVYLKNIDSQNKYLLNPGDIVMILSDITREGRLIGNVGIIPDDGKNYFLNQRVAKIETDKKYILYLLNLFTSKEFHQHCLSRADSATVLNLKNEHIHDYEIALPENNIFKRFDELIEPIINKKEHIKYENQKLSLMRDLLLPKLMKGRIRIIS